MYYLDNCERPYVYVPREQKYSQAIFFAEFILAILNLNREIKFFKNYGN